METLTNPVTLQERCFAWRCQGKAVGFIPTMGALHQGHASLFSAAREQNDIVVASIFVNPLQFGPGEDLELYPRSPASDAALARRQGVDLLFTPRRDALFPGGFQTQVTLPELSLPLCGSARPGHFAGVATVVTKLLVLILPSSLYLGQKDAQQAVLLRRLIKDLGFPTRPVICPTVREPSGLALSSRNRYLDEEQKRSAAVLYRALRAGSETVVSGERAPGPIVQTITEVLGGEPGVKVEYVEVRNWEDLSQPVLLAGDTLLALAARVGSARLIDNMIVKVPV